MICFLERASNTPDAGARLVLWKDAASTDYNAEVPPPSLDVVLPPQKAIATTSKPVKIHSGPTN